MLSGGNDDNSPCWWSSNSSGRRGASRGAAGGSVIGPHAGTQAEGGVDQRHVGERLGEVAEQPPVGRVELLGEEPEVVGRRQAALEQLGGLVHVPLQGEGV